MSGPVPSEEELVAIAAAVEMAWPRPVVAAPAADKPGPWRFSGRWWAKPHTVQRSRPWVDVPSGPAPPTGGAWR